MTTVGIGALLILGAAALISLAILTAIGERRRGGGLAVVVVAGLFFPLAWVAWYSHDKEQLQEPSPSRR